MAETLNPRDRGAIVSVTQALATGVPFVVDTHDVTTETPCVLLAIEVVVPAGETVTITKKLASGNSIPLRTTIPSGTYAVGEWTPLEPGDSLQLVTVNEQPGVREIQITATTRGG